MKKLSKLILSFLLVMLGAGIVKGSSDIRLVEEGRTWWYGYVNYDEPVASGMWMIRFFGLSITGTEVIDGETWYKCVVVSEEGQPMMDFPVAWLREEGAKVYVFPYTITESEWEEIKHIPNQFHYVFTRFLDMTSPYRVCRDYRQDINGEILLYDWAMMPDQIIDYPWYIKDYGFHPITIQTCTLDNDRKSWTATWNSHTECVIVEGIGIVGNDRNHIGTFLYPGCYESPLTGPSFTPEDVYLHKVTDREGNIIYNSYWLGIEQTVIDISSDAPIYDLHGRKVTNPVPGTIYVRDGRKFVAR